MSDPDEVRRRTAWRTTVTPGPDDIQTIVLPGGMSIVVDMIGRTVTIDAPAGGDTGGWTVTDQRPKRARNT